MSVVAEVQNNNSFSLIEEKNMDSISSFSSDFIQSFQFRVSVNTSEIDFGIKTLLLYNV